jgi:type 1 glutamine amidotransferase
MGGAAKPRVLVFSHSTGYRHASIEPGVTAIKALGARDGFDVDASEDPDIFAPDRLAPYRAIVFISNSTNGKDQASEWFVGARRDALMGFVHRGGGVVGIHAASDSHYFWPWYGAMIGAYFDHHPPGTPTGKIEIVDRRNPATRNLPREATRVDEWYHFKTFDPAKVHALIMFEPASIGETIAPYPISWCHAFEGGRVFYTAMGHTPESYQEKFFLDHIAGGIRWALGKEPCG